MSSPTIRDLFCGAGGSSLGAQMAGVELKHALNHWDRAIETHAENFPAADHSCADIASLTTAQIRRMVPTDILWASPECTNHSMAKGSRRRPPQVSSLWEDGPAGDAEQDRSRATMWDVVRFAEQGCLSGRPYRAIIVENVVDAVKWGAGDNGQLFASWLLALDGLGYRHEVVFLNSMVCWPTPQSRDRIYVVFWLAGMRAPDLRFEPVSWCPTCEKIVNGRQTWKRPGGDPRYGRVWGRYGAQYYYCCPECFKGVLPAAYPASSIIDWELPAQRIGDRDKPLADATRQRIRRGLDRLAGEEFAIKLTHAGAPRPLSLPLVTLTARHDAAMVFPVAGNTFETTPGNRAKDAQLVPLDVVHTCFDRAMVMPPMGGVDPRSASIPVSTMTTTTRPAVVVPERRNTVAQLPDAEPVSTLCASGGHHALVMRNNTPRGDAGQMSTPTREPMRTITASNPQSLVLANMAHNLPSIADEEPAATVTTGGRLAIVVPYTRTGEAFWAEERPMCTLTTRDRACLVTTEANIDDCRFRMFSLPEIAGAMAMDRHADGSPYRVLGNKREQMRQYGNAVTAPAARMLIERVLEIL